MSILGDLSKLSAIEALAIDRLELLPYTLAEAGPPRACWARLDEAEQGQGSGQKRQLHLKASRE